MNSTVRIKASEVYKDWHVIDAAGRPLGRVATEVATLLRGKHKPTYEPHLDDGDFVIVINASQVKVSGRKAEQNTYYTHSGYPGGLKARSFADQMARFPDRVIEQAVWGMLPGGPLGKKMIRHLKVYAGANHPHQSQIAGSLKAQEARKAATAELGNVILKAPRLRPSACPRCADVPPAPAPVAAAPSPAAAVAKQARARVRKTAEPAPAAVAEAPVAEAVTEAPAPEAPTAEAPKRTRRKAAVADAPEATAEAKAEAKPKPSRRSPQEPHAAARGQERNEQE